MDIKQINKRCAYIKIEDVIFYIDYTLEKPIIDSWKEGDEIEVKETKGGFIPLKPHRAYKDDFKGWADFLGVKQKNNNMKITTQITKMLYTIEEDDKYFITDQQKFMKRITEKSYHQLNKNN